MPVSDILQIVVVEQSSLVNHDKLKHIEHKRKTPRNFRAAFFISPCSCPRGSRNSH